MEPGWQSVGSLGSGGGPVNLNTSLWRRLGFVLLPPRCLVCGAPGAGRDLCRDCADELPWNAAACARCALPLPAAAPACGACLRAPPPQVGSWAPLRYAAPLDQLLPRFKFHADLASGRLLASLLLQALPQPPAAFDALVPMPLHRARLGRRGYNQALELARPLAAALRIPLADGLLSRTKPTAAQTNLDAKTRRRNLRGAFEFHGTGAHAAELKSAHVALIDDVMTTGATLRECARVLRRAGVARVDAWALARAPKSR